MPIFVLKNEATAARRLAYFHCVDATDGITPETGEAGGQPQISLDGASWTNTGIGVLVAIGNGRYSGELTQSLVNVDNAVIETRYKSAATAESIGSTSQVVKQWADILADVTGLNGDVMRGTDSANTVVPPSVAQFNARTIVSADYVVVGDTIAGVANLTNAPRLSPFTWYVDGVNGSSGNGGTSWADAEDTVANGLAHMANGDTLIVAASTYTEQIDASGLADITIELLKGAVLTSATSPTLEIGHRNLVTGKGSVACTEEGSSESDPDNPAIFSDASTDSPVVRGISATGEIGIYLNFIGRCVVENCDVQGKEYGVYVDSTKGSQAVVRSNSLQATGWTHCHAAALAFGIQTDGIAIDNDIRTTIAATDATHIPSGVMMVGNNNVALINNRIESAATTGGYSYGIWLFTLGGASVSVTGGQILTSSTVGTGNIYDLVNVDGELVVGGVSYDSAKTSGTILYAPPGETMRGTDSANTTTPPTAIENADALLARGVGNVEDTADPHSLCTIVLAGLESAVAGTTWTILKTDGITTFLTKTVAVDAAADPIVSVT